MIAKIKALRDSVVDIKENITHKDEDYSKGVIDNCKMFILSLDKMLDIKTMEDLGFEKYKIKNGIHHYTHKDTFLNIEIYLEENYYKCYGCIANELHQAIMLKMEEIQNETN